MSVQKYINLLEKYRPTKFSDYLGNISHIKTIKDWIKNFKDQDKDFLILYGIPGVGKTTLAYLIFNHYNYEIIEINTSVHRSRKNIHSLISCMNSKTIVSKKMKSKIIPSDTNKFENKNNKKNKFKKKNKSTDNNVEFLKTGLLMDEIDGITTNAESSGIQELHKIVINNKQSNRYPIICTCNSIKNKKIKDLEKRAIFINLDRPTKFNLLNLAMRICKNENIQINKDNLDKLVDNCLEYRDLINKLYQINLSCIQIQKQKQKQKQKYNSSSLELKTIDSISSDILKTEVDEIKFIESIALKIKHILTNKISNNDIEFQVEESSNVFILNLYINVIKIMKYLKVKNVKFENVSLLNGKILEHRMINLFSKCLVDIDIYHNKLFINHFWELNKYMITEFTYLLKMFKNNINFFIKDIDKIKFKNTNLVLDHHSEFNKMSQNQSSFKKENSIK